MDGERRIGGTSFGKPPKSYPPSYSIRSAAKSLGWLFNRTFIWSTTHHIINHTVNYTVNYTINHKINHSLHSQLHNQPLITHSIAQSTTQLNK